MEKLPQTVNEFDKLLSLEKIEHRHLEALSADDKTAFMDMVYHKLARLGESALDAMVAKTIGILDNEFVWEYNHGKITEAIKKHTYANGTVPGVSHLAATCHLSRKTVREHLRAFNSSEARAEQKETISLMRQNIMGTVIKAALKGDLKAAKIYLETTKGPTETEMLVNNQNNYVQINKTVINQHVIQQLKPEQLQLIEQIIAGSEKRPE